MSAFVGIFVSGGGVLLGSPTTLVDARVGAGVLVFFFFFCFHHCTTVSTFVLDFRIHESPPSVVGGLPAARLAAMVEATSNTKTCLTFIVLVFLEGVGDAREESTIITSALTRIYAIIRFLLQTAKGQNTRSQPTTSLTSSCCLEQRSFFNRRGSQQLRSQLPLQLLKRS